MGKVSKKRGKDLYVKGKKRKEMKWKIMSVYNEVWVCCEGKKRHYT